MINLLPNYHDIPERITLNGMNYSLDGGILYVSYYDFETKEFAVGPDALHPLLKLIMEHLNITRFEDIQDNSIYLFEKGDAYYETLNMYLDNYLDISGPHALCGYKCDGNYHIMNSYNTDQTGYVFDWYNKVIREEHILIRFKIYTKRDGTISKPEIMVYRPFNMDGTTLFYINDSLEAPFAPYREVLNRVRTDLVSSSSVELEAVKPYVYTGEGGAKKKKANRKTSRKMKDSAKLN